MSIYAEQSISRPRGGKLECVMLDALKCMNMHRGTLKHHLKVLSGCLGPQPVLSGLFILPGQNYFFE